MLRIERQQKCFSRLELPDDLCGRIRYRAVRIFRSLFWISPDQFFAEVGEELFVVAKRLNPLEIGAGQS